MSLYFTESLPSSPIIDSCINTQIFQGINYYSIYTKYNKKLINLFYMAIKLAWWEIRGISGISRFFTMACFTDGCRQWFPSQQINVYKYYHIRMRHQAWKQIITWKLTCWQFNYCIHQKTTKNVCMVKLPNKYVL